MKSFFAIILLLAGGYGHARADADLPMTSQRERSVYTLQDCLAIGLREAASLRQAERDLEIADSAIGQVRAQFLPQVSADASYTRRDKLDRIEFGEQRMEVGSLDNYALSVGVRQLLYSGGALSAALDAARDFRIMADIRAEQARATLERDIRAGFADLLYLGEAVVVNALAVEQWRETLVQTEQRFEQDMASEFDVLNARVQWANALPSLIQASNRLALAKTSFADLIRLPESDFDVRGELLYEPFVAEMDALLCEARSARSELRLARQGLALREAEIRSEQSAYRPSLRFSAQYGAQRGPFDFGDGGDLDWRWSATLSAQWSFLDGGLRRSRVREKALERDKTREDIETLERRVALEVRQAVLALRQADESVAAMRETAGLAERSQAIASTRYRTGLATRLELAEANMALTTARLHWLGALREHTLAVIALRHAVGRR